MASSNDNKLYMPDGLPLEPMDPVWFSELWPMNLLDSTIGSVIMVSGLFILLAAVFFGLAYVAKTFLPNWLKGFAKLVFILAGAASIAGAGMSGMSWSQDDNLSDKALGVQVTRTTDWLKTKNVSADNRAVWDLVCLYYDDRNKNCREQNATVYYKGQPEKVRLEKQTDGAVVLYDFENLVPLVE